MTEKELMEYSLDRLLNILYMNIRLLEHYVVRDDLYNKNNYLDVITDLYKINSVIMIKYGKRKKK